MDDESDGLHGSSEWTSLLAVSVIRGERKPRRRDGYEFPRLHCSTRSPYCWSYAGKAKPRACSCLGIRCLNRP